MMESLLCRRWEDPRWTMAKAKMYGMTNSYMPNARNDMRYRKRLYQRNREIAEWVPGQKKTKQIAGSEERK